jgi:gamma-glutamyltranspeptidase/glutathione hydrolase
MAHTNSRALAAALLGITLLGASAAAQDTPARDPNFGRGERVSGQSFATRSPVIAPHGAAATAHPLATQTAIDVMRAGGTAIDAAIAANAMLGLVEPTANGIGGDIFVIVWDPRTQRLYGYNGSGRSPRPKFGSRAGVSCAAALVPSSAMPSSAAASARELV